MKHILTAVIASVVAALWFSAPAGADINTWTYDVNWGGPPTLLVTEYGGAETHVELAFDGYWTGVGYAPSGMFIGVDPHIDPDLGTGVTWASCTLYINGYAIVSDYASAGDGTELACVAFAP